MKGDFQFLGSHHTYQLLGQNFSVHAEKGLFWEEQKALIISDVHLGKAAHFRKHGVPIPRQIHIVDFQRVNSLISHYRPKQIVFLGDLFHSDQNHEWEDFVYWSQHHSGIRQVLVKGNHDILDESQYQKLDIEVVSDWLEGPFLFTHEPTKTDHYNIYGHIHPSIRLRGLGRQGAILSCFHFQKEEGVVPAFGNFTGHVAVRPSSGDKVFAIAEGKLIGITA